MKKSNQPNSPKKRKKENIDELSGNNLTEQQNADIQTFTEIIVEIVMKEFEKEILKQKIGKFYLAFLINFLINQNLRYAKTL